MRARFLTAAVLLAACPLLAAPPPPRVAQISLVRGRASVDGHLAHIFTTVRQGDTVTVPSGSRLTLFFFASGHTEMVTGPARFVAHADGSHLGAAHMQARVPPPALTAAGGALHRVIGDQYAVEVSRGKQYESYTPLGTPEVQPKFRWEAIPGVSEYHFAIMSDPEAKPLREIPTAQPEITHLGIKLEPGHTYFWSINDDRQFHSIHILSTAEQHRLAQAEAAFAASPHDTADSLLLAATCDSLGMSDRERDVLEAAENRDRDNPVMHRLLWDLDGQTDQKAAQQAEEAWLNAHPEL
ncbi:MAG: hypothetical protein ACYCW6_22225 [Candidatus Xenobia bacterium]